MLVLSLLVGPVVDDDDDDDDDDGNGISRRSQAQQLQHGPLSARRELQSHPLAGQAQACGRLTKSGRAGGPDGTFRDHWCSHCRKKEKPFSRVILVLGTMLIFLYRSTGDPRIVHVILAPEPCNLYHIDDERETMMTVCRQALQN